jgi:hypothetical protein
MSIAAFILMFFFLSFGVALYVIGILVVERVDLAVQLDHKVQQCCNWVSLHGSQQQRQAARLAAENRDLENLQSLVGMDLLSS